MDNTIPDLEPQYFSCQCHSYEHTLIFTLDRDDNEIYTSVFLDSPRFLKRIWIGIKYIFGYKSRFGHWDCFILRPQDAERLIKILQELKPNRKCD